MNQLLKIEDFEFNDEVIDIEVEYKFYNYGGYDYDNNMEGCSDSYEIDILEITNLETNELIEFKQLTGKQISLIEEEIMLEN